MTKFYVGYQHRITDSCRRAGPLGASPEHVVVSCALRTSNLPERTYPNVARISFPLEALCILLTDEIVACETQGPLTGVSR